MLLTQSLYSQITINTNQATTLFKVMDNDSIKFGIGDPVPMSTHIFADSFKVESYSTVYTKYLKVTGKVNDREYSYEEGTFFFTHDVEKDLFTVDVDGKPYLNFHANLFGRREGRSIYMVNPNSFVEYNEEYLKFESDDEDTLIYFYR